MRQQTINTGLAYERANIRNAKVRRLTLWSGALLVMLCLSAIWQDRALAPPLHDGMQSGVTFVMGYVSENEMLSEVLAGFQVEYAKLINDG